MSKVRWLVCVAAAVGMGSGSASAQNARFDVDPAASIIDLSGSVLGVPIQPQGPGSLRTSYFGSLVIQLSPNSIHFPGASDVTANDSGSWQPLPGGAAGSAPANYGGQVTIIFVGTGRFAPRDVVFDVLTPAPLTLATAGTFSSAVTFQATAGTVDYNSPLGTGSEDMTGSSAINDSPNSGSFTIAPAASGFATGTLGLPVRFTVVGELKGVGQGTFNFNGSITARASARPGDANFDGQVNLDDFNVLASNFGTSGRNWLGADFTFDGMVNLDDFNALASNFGMAASANGPTLQDWSALASALPEPSIAALSFTCAFLLLSGRFRGRFYNARR